MRLKMSKLFLFTLLCFCSVSYGIDPRQLKQLTNSQNSEDSKDIALLDNEISLLYQKGPVLLYDCLSSHWVCTGEVELNRCEREKNVAILERKKQLPCAYIHKFKSKEECHARQQIFINRSIAHDFCANRP